MKTFIRNTEDFAYKFTEDKEGLTVEVWHRDGLMIKEETIKF